MILAALTLMISIACYSISQLVQHKKFKWMSKDPYGFWGEEQDKRKYDIVDGGRLPSRNNWYTKLAGIKYKERWFTSTNLTVAFTDGYHLMQFFHHLFLAITLGLLTDVSYIPWVWIGIICVHAGAYKIFQR